MRKGLQRILLIVAVLLGLIGLLIPLPEVQVAKNRAQLGNMRDRVQAVKAFHERNARFPTHAELVLMFVQLPDRWGYNPEYWFDTSPKENTNGWALSFSRGDNDARYTSWDNHYTLSDELSWRCFWGPLWWPLVSAGLLSVLAFTACFMLREGARFVEPPPRPHSSPGAGPKSGEA